jgi:hypothetical protein
MSGEGTSPLAEMRKWSRLQLMDSIRRDANNKEETVVCYYAKQWQWQWNWQWQLYKVKHSKNIYRSFALSSPAKFYTNSTN